MRNQNTRNHRQNKQVADAQVLLMTIMLAVVSFAAGYYFAAMQAAGMISK
jgi:hypothetical protein